jgi:hypothetical protein
MRIRFPVDEFNAAISYCIHHDAWTNAEEQLKEWSEAKALATAAS